MRVAIVCEFSGVVRDAFIRRGHEAISFDLIESESSFGSHVIGDVTLLPREYWEQFDLAICHPPCTHLAVSGAKHFAKKLEENPRIQEDALDFVRWCMGLPVGKICVENPISIISSRIRKPDQIIQPWMFGHGEIKATCFWLKGLEKLVATDIVDGREHRSHFVPEGKNRWKIRSRTLLGIAEAMASQWGGEDK